MNNEGQNQGAAYGNDSVGAAYSWNAGAQAQNNAPAKPVNHMEINQVETVAAEADGAAAIKPVTENGSKANNPVINADYGNRGQSNFSMPARGANNFNVPNTGVNNFAQNAYETNIPYNNPFNMNAQGMGVQNNGRKSTRNDHTAEFDKKDILENKIMAIVPYLMGAVGVIIALIAAKSSDYVMFHVRQALKLSICAILLSILAIPFGVLGLIPYVGVIFKMIVGVIGITEIGIFILRIIAFFQVCDGKAKEPVIVGGFFNH